MTVLDHSRPFYKVEFYEPEATEPKVIFSPNIFLETEKPSDAGKMSSDVYVSHLTLNSKLDGAVNTCDFEIRHTVGGILVFDLGYKVKAYLGFYDQAKDAGPDYSLAFVGYITQIKNGLEKSNIMCKSSLKNITNKKVKITFSKIMSFDEIVKKFAIEVGGLSEAPNGIYNPNLNKQTGFGISEQKPLIDYIKRLAEYSGTFVFLDVFDNFHSIPWDTSKLKEISSQDTHWLLARNKDESENSDFYKHKIAFDERLVDIKFETVANKYSGVEVISSMPFSDDPAYTIEPVKVEFKPEGANDSELPIKRYKLSHIIREDAEKIAENLYWRESRLMSGNIKLFGAPQIRVGDGVTFEGELLGQTPFGNITFNDSGTDNDLENVIFQVSQVTHKFDTVEGFVTHVKFIYSHVTVVDAGTTTGEGAGDAWVDVVESTETEFAGIAAEIVPIGRETEEEREERLVNIIVRTLDPTNEPMPNTEYVLIKPDEEEIEGTTGDDGTFTHEEMVVGRYQLKLKPITDPSEEEGEETEEE